MKIHLVLSDDWELRGNGSGNMPAIQFNTARRLMDVYERFGFRASFNVEVMQQLYHVSVGRRKPQLRDLASQWEDVVIEMYQRGHDVQLHAHIQWEGARHEETGWALQPNWSIIEYTEPIVRRVISTCREYLESLVRRVDPDYKCVAFRSGSWSLAPSPCLLTVLADNGIVFDMSMVAGLRYDKTFVRLDYRDVEEPFLPYYPDMTDARRLATTPQPIVCVPTHSFFMRGVRAILSSPHVIHRLSRITKSVYAAPCDTRLPGAGGYGAGDTPWQSTAPPAGVFRRARNLWLGGHCISDLSALNSIHTKCMLDDIALRAARMDGTAIPVVLENHTKDIGDFYPVERFCETVARMTQLEVVTSSRVAANITNGVYPIRYRGDAN